MPERGKEKCVEEVYNDPEARKQFIKMIEAEVSDTINTVLVNAIKAANERPSKWWEWLMLLAAGALAGTGLGVVLAFRGVVGG